MDKIIPGIVLCLLLTACADQQEQVHAVDLRPLDIDIREPYRAHFGNVDRPLEITPYAYPNYHAYFESYINGLGWAFLPSRLQWKWRACIVGFTLIHFNDDELWALNAFARGQLPARAAEVSALHRTMTQRVGPTDRDLENAVREYCPETIAALEPYIMNGEYKTTYMGAD